MQDTKKDLRIQKTWIPSSFPPFLAGKLAVAHLLSLSSHGKIGIKQSWRSFPLTAAGFCSGVFSSHQMNLEWRQPLVWALGVHLHTELTPAHHCCPKEKANGINDEMLGRHLRAFRKTHMLHSHSVDVWNCHSCISKHLVVLLVVKTLTRVYLKESCWVCLRK